MRILHPEVNEERIFLKMYEILTNLTRSFSEQIRKLKRDNHDKRFFQKNCPRDFRIMFFFCVSRRTFRDGSKMSTARILRATREMRGTAYTCQVSLGTGISWDKWYRFAAGTHTGGSIESHPPFPAPKIEPSARVKISSGARLVVLCVCIITHSAFREISRRGEPSTPRCTSRSISHKKCVVSWCRLHRLLFLVVCTFSSWRRGRTKIPSRSGLPDRVLKQARKDSSRVSRKTNEDAISKWEKARVCAAREMSCARARKRERLRKQQERAPE